MFEEKQLPRLVKGKWLQKVYVYNTANKLGHPLNQRDDELTAEQAQVILDQNKPETITFRPLADGALQLFDARAILKAWAKDNPIVALFFGKEVVTLDRDLLTKMETIVTEDKDDPNSPLTSDVGAQLLTMLQDLKSKVK